MADQAPEEAAAETDHPATKVDGKLTMAVKIFAPFQVYYEGDAFSVSAINDVGPFDILPKHRNFLCMLVPCTIKVQTASGEKSVKINRALMHVKANRVVVFVDV